MLPSYFEETLALAIGFSLAAVLTLAGYSFVLWVKERVSRAKDQKVKEEYFSILDMENPVELAPISPENAADDSPEADSPEADSPERDFSEIAGARKKPVSPARQQYFHLAEDVKMDMLFIRSGFFWMGSNDEQAPEEERPGFYCYLNEFWLGQYPVTNKQYQAFLESTDHAKPDGWQQRPDLDNRPVVNVTWDDAVAFCQWLNEITPQDRPANRRTSLVFRLPTEAEWEKAARGQKARMFPWGKTAPNARTCNFSGSKIFHPTPVGHYSAVGDSSYGCEDMAGNVWEWTHTCWNGVDKNYPYDMSDGRENHSSPEMRVLRGGSFNSTADEVRSTARICGQRGSYLADRGFRVCIGQPIEPGISDRPPLGRLIDRAGVQRTFLIPDYVLMRWKRDGLITCLERARNSQYIDLYDETKLFDLAKDWLKKNGTHP